MASRWLMGIVLALLAGWATSWAGEVVPLGDGIPRTPVVVPEVDYEGEFAAQLKPVPLVNYSRTQRRFNRQDLTIHIFMFTDPERAFSAFTTMRKTGAKTYSGRLDCYLQQLDMIFCAGKYVVQTRFPGFPLLHLTAYLDWLQIQFPQQVAIPASYLRLPDAGRWSHTRQHLVADFQVNLIWPAAPADLFGLDRGNRLTIACYRRGAEECWAGWLRIHPDGEGAPVLSPPGHSWSGWQADLRPVHDRYAVTIATPAGAAWAMTMLDTLAQHRPGTGGGAPIREGYFRRDQFTYSNIVFSGLQLVLLFLGLAVATAVGVYILWRLLRKMREPRSGPDAEAVCHLHLDGLPVRGEKKRNISDSDL
ncbi:MAG: hypothetical protein JXQ27_03085 [Acidobacteria bacterium]|nr:hypothetical protein [Acidobacteriota bacterium]